MASILVLKTACRRSGLRCAGVVDSEKTVESEWVELVSRYVPFLHHLSLFFCVFDLCFAVLCLCSPPLHVFLLMSLQGKC